VPLLFVAPIAAAIWQLRTGSKTGRYNKGMELFNLGVYRRAAACLEPPAKEGHSAAQFALATIYERRSSGMKHLSKAHYWFERAARRGHAEAQYVLGNRYRKPKEAIDWYHKAAKRGVPDAAFRLGFCYETGKGVEADKDEAANWYHWAGQLFLKARRLEDVEMAITSLNGLMSEHPFAAKLQNLMTQAVAKP